MARKRGPLLVALSLIFAMSAAWLANNWMAARASARPKAVQVVTAALDIPLGTQLESRHLATLEMLPGTVPRSSYRTKKALEGKIAKAPMLAGDIILEPRITDLGNGSALAAVVEKNMRAITVRVDDVVGVGGFLLPGNRVDVLATRKNNNEEPVTETILGNVKVLAVDQTAAANSMEPVVVRAVTLEVSPADAEILTKGKAAGTLQLTLRNPLDDKIFVKAKPAPEKVAARVVVAPPRPVAAPTITVIRGTEIGRTNAR